MEFENIFLNIKIIIEKNNVIFHEIKILQRFHRLSTDRIN